MMLSDRYARGFKYCTYCTKWVEPGAEMYNGDNNIRPLCPDCKRILKTRPRGDKAKERFALMTTGKPLTRY